MAKSKDVRVMEVEVVCGGERKWVPQWEAAGLDKEGWKLTGNRRNVMLPRELVHESKRNEARA